MESQDETPIEHGATDMSAMSFLSFTHQYLNAANQLFERQGSPSHSDPIDFLYFQTAELGLKAFLLAHDLPIPYSHRLTEIYEQCRSLGLVIGPHPYELGDILSFLESGNENQGFRYPTWKSTASLPWIREVVEQLVHAVEPYVYAWHERNPNKTSGKLNVTIGKPVPKPGKWASARIDLRRKRTNQAGEKH